MINRIRKIYGFKKSIKNSTIFQIIFFYLTGNVLFIIFLISIFYYSSKRIILQKEIEYNRERTQNKSHYISLYIEKLKNIVNLIAIDGEVEGFLDTGSSLYEFGIRKTVESIFAENKGIRSITLVGKETALIFNRRAVEKVNSSSMIKENWYVNTLENPDIPVFTPSQNFSDPTNKKEWGLSLSHHIRRLADGKDIGVVVLDIKYDTFNQYLGSTHTKVENESIIVDDKNNIIYYKDTNCFINKSCLEKFSLKKNHKEVSIIESKIENTDWKLISIANMDSLVVLKKKFANVIVTIFLISFMFTSLVTFLVITKMLNPLAKLKNHMQNFENTLREFEPGEGANYEVRVLTEHFNDMIQKIRYLRKYEIQILHSQINPHFLYNTLDTIIWMAEFEDSNKVIAITKSLANFFRLSLSNGQEMISLKDEIMHIKEYLFIQKQRYEEKLTYFFNIEESLLSINVPKIILQPIVENSIYHGIKNIPDTGIINIDVYSNEDKVIISVRDNGIGFSESKKLHKSKTGGIGIQNVDKRIKYYYGNEYGIFMEEVLDNNRGSLVLIKLPLT